MDTHSSIDEIQLLRLCSKVSPSNKDIQTIKNLVLKINPSYQILISLAYKHAVFPLLYQTIKNILPHHHLVTILKPYQTKIIQKNMAMAIDLMYLISFLQKYNIETLSFKGLVLSHMMYGDISLRQFGDLDLLIHAKDREKAITLLEKNAYHAEITLKKQSKEIFFNAVNVLGFYSPSKTLMEIHWELLSKNYAISWSEARLWRNPKTITIHNQNIKTLDSTTTLLYLCTHGSKHLFSRLSWLCDIDRTLNKSEIVWQEVLTEAKELGITRMLLLSLSLSHTLLDTPLPEEIHILIKKDPTVDSIVTDIIKLHFTTPEKQSKDINTFKILLSMREGIKAKIHFTYLALFTAKFDDFKYIQLPKYLAFLYPLVRILRLGGKYLK